MARIAPVKTPSQVKADFARRGVSVRSWAIDNNFSPSLVCEILNKKKGRKCLRGESHRIAVRLGIKRGEITNSKEGDEK
jgi:gp16 family phage-associated protein